MERQQAVCSCCLQRGHRVAECQSDVTHRASGVSCHKRGDPTCRASGQSGHKHGDPTCRASGVSGHKHGDPTCRASGESGHKRGDPTCRASGESGHKRGDPTCRASGVSGHKRGDPTCRARELSTTSRWGDSLAAPQRKWSKNSAERNQPSDAPDTWQAIGRCPSRQRERRRQTDKQNRTMCEEVVTCQDKWQQVKETKSSQANLDVLVYRASHAIPHSQTKARRGFPGWR